MEKVFSDTGLSKFDVRKLSDINKPASSTKLAEEQVPTTVNVKYNEKDYDCKFLIFNGLKKLLIRY